MKTISASDYILYKSNLLKKFAGNDYQFAELSRSDMFQISLFMAEEKSDGQLSFEVRQQISLEKMMNQLNFFDMTLKCDPQVDCNGSGTCINQP